MKNAVLKFVFRLVLAGLVLGACEDDPSGEVEASVTLTMQEVSLVRSIRLWQELAAGVDYRGREPVTVYGFVYSADTGAPTLENAEVIDLSVNGYPGSWTNTGFSYRFDKEPTLAPGETYFARAYIKIGEQVHYSERVSFKTLTGGWTKRASFPGAHRSRSVTFTLGGKLYLVGGISLEQEGFNDVWSYDPATDAWTERAPFPLDIITTERTARFVVDNVAYIVLYNGLWRYQESTDAWESIGDGVNQNHMISFSAAGKGYAGLGQGYYNGELYRYDPAQGNWASIPRTVTSAYPGDGEEGRSVVVAGDKVYVGYGQSTFTDEQNAEFYAYDPVLSQWQKLASFLSNSAMREGMTCFAAKSKVYIGLGKSIYGKTVLGDLNEYNPASNTWQDVASFPGTERLDALAWSTEEKGYVGLGFLHYTQGQVDKLSDFWEFKP